MKNHAIHVSTILMLIPSSAYAYGNYEGVFAALGIMLLLTFIIIPQGLITLIMYRKQKIDKSWKLITGYLINTFSFIAVIVMTYILLQEIGFSRLFITGSGSGLMGLAAIMAAYGGVIALYWYPRKQFLENTRSKT
ncbi:hypothetical protein QUF61_12195 [Candidatus Venteria ishoeyi]|uniref:hypothetical protein n=1 Tax=Candidatus Venteria ishoeyi TaxID=1899563 RepID=UPI0025A5E050|nr:hypothetical protein [Candidatus Venteria ishoeyi]MDM8547248.1 hypothetical protein [Candidatus Venteria ishoeyi]